MTAKTPQFPLHYVDEPKPQTGFDYVSKGTVARVDPDPVAEHGMALQIALQVVDGKETIASAVELLDILGLTNHTCKRCDERRSA